MRPFLVLFFHNALFNHFEGRTFTKIIVYHHNALILNKLMYICDNQKFIKFNIMKGRKEFTKAELEKLTQLFKLKDDAPIEEKKRLRDEIRDIGFYISDFAPTMTYYEFSVLVNSGGLKIIDK